MAKPLSGSATVGTSEAQSLLPKYKYIDGSDTESEVERQSACRGMSLVAVVLFLTLVTLRYATPWFFQKTNDGCPEQIPFCWLQPISNHPIVKTGQPGFPSFWDYAPQGPIDVSYDGRSFMLNGERALFLGGSMHPSRATQETWENSLDLAVQNGLNMVTIYVFWADHQPLPGKDIDFTLPAGICREDNRTLPSCGWSLADAIRAAAMRGLFVHARIGP